ncbi:unnamed protein product [Clonostachys rhizophaga]|uniref:Uncharacterized protein n=1 Tax=Clonostachys rhizophaga TaxID=160324 RepID=A0A9N9VNC3_9HYPO|nr:unnamed protein product [Clonostachys rhizophaga]
MDNLPPIGSLGPPQNTNLPWVRWAEIDAANDNARNRNTAWKIYLVYLREGSSWEADSHREIGHYFLVARLYRQPRVSWSSPSAAQLWRAANLCEENWTVALGHFLITQYPTHGRLLFWAFNRRVYPAVHGGVRRPRPNDTINRTSGPGPPTADDTDNLVSLSESLGVESYYSGIPPMVVRVEVSENASQSLALTDDDTKGGSQESESGSLSDDISPEGNSANTTVLESSPEPELEPEAELEEDGQRPLVATTHSGQHDISSRNERLSTSYFRAYSPASVLNNALRGLEPEFEEYDTRTGISPRLPTPGLPHHEPQPMHMGGELTGHSDVQLRQTISELIHIVKGDVDKLSHELLVHKRAAANRRADIRDDAARLGGEFDNFRTNTLDTLEGITKRVILVEQSVTRLCQNYGSMNSLEEANTGDTSPIPSHTEMFTMISAIKEQITGLLAVDRAPDPRVAQIQRSLNTTQGYFEQCIQDMEKDIWDLKRKHEADALTINNLKRHITTQFQINATMMETLQSMEIRVDHQLRALDARLEVRQGE